MAGEESNYLATMTDLVLILLQFLGLWHISCIYIFVFCISLEEFDNNIVSVFRIEILILYQSLGI